MARKLVVLLTVPLLALAACSSTSSEESSTQESAVAESAPASAAPSADAAASASAAPEGTLTIGVAFPGDAPYLDGYKKGLEETAAARGVELSILNAQWDAATQDQQIQQLSSSGVDGMIIWPVDSAAVCTAVDAVAGLGIPMVSSNSNVGDACADKVVAYTGPDNAAQGCESAKLMGALAPDARVVIIEGVQGTDPAINRTAGFEECLPDGITILDKQPADWDKAKATKVTADLLTRFGDEVTAVYAQDDTMAVGAAAAVQDAGLEGITILGIGGSGAGLDAVKDGVLSGTIIQSPVSDGTFAVNAIVDSLEGAQVEARQILPMPTVSQENVDTFTAEW